MERTLRTGFFRVGEHWAFVVWPASLRGHSCFSFVLPSSSSLFLSLSLLHLGFVSPRLWQSFILYHKLCFVSTHAHTSKHLPPSPILFMDHCARTNWHMYIHKELFFSPSPFVCLCVRVCMRVLQRSWEVPLARLACARSLGAFLSLTLSRFGCVETGSLFLQSRPSQSNQKNRNAKNLSQVFLFFFVSSEVIPPVLSHTPKVSQD